MILVPTKAKRKKNSNKIAWHVWTACLFSSGVWPLFCGPLIKFSAYCRCTQVSIPWLILRFACSAILASFASRYQHLIVTCVRFSLVARPNRPLKYWANIVLVLPIWDLGSTVTSRLTWRLAVLIVLSKRSLTKISSIRLTAPGSPRMPQSLHVGES